MGQRFIPGLSPWIRLRLALLTANPSLVISASSIVLSLCALALSASTFYRAFLYEKQELRLVLVDFAIDTDTRRPYIPDDGKFHYALINGGNRDLFLNSAELCVAPNVPPYADGPICVQKGAPSTTVKAGEIQRITLELSNPLFSDEVS